MEGQGSLRLSSPGEPRDLPSGGMPSTTGPSMSLACDTSYRFSSGGSSFLQPHPPSLRQPQSAQQQQQRAPEEHLNPAELSVGLSPPVDAPTPQAAEQGLRPKGQAQVPSSGAAAAAWCSGGSGCQPPAAATAAAAGPSTGPERNSPDVADMDVAPGSQQVKDDPDDADEDDALANDGPDSGSDGGGAAGSGLGDGGGTEGQGSDKGGGDEGQRKSQQQHQHHHYHVNSITLADLQAWFHVTIEAAAHGLGIGLTTMKALCRKYHIPRWPYRKLLRVKCLITKLQAGTCRQQGARDLLQL